MHIQYTKTELNKATQKLASWLEDMSCDSLKSRAHFCRALLEFRSRNTDDDLLVLAAFKNMDGALESITGMALCMTDHCDEFSESAQDLLDDGSIIQTHADLVLTLERHVFEISQVLNKQRVLAMVLAEAIGVEYSPTPIAN